MVYDVIIIGAGPAGMSAGVYACREKLSTLILSPDIGGQTAQSWEVENYMGYSLITGAELSAKFKEHLDKFDCAVFKVGAEVVNLKKSNGKFEIKTRKGESYQGKTVIITSGKVPRQLGVPGEKEFSGKGVTYCATCDAPLFKNKTVAVVGGGDSALDATYQLTKIASRIYLLVRGSKFKNDLDKILMENVTASDKVKVIFNASTTKIYGSQFVEGLEYQNLKTKEKDRLVVKGIFVEIGSVPSTEFIRGLVALNQWNEIKIDKHNMTSVPGIFAAGDVTEVVEKQTIIAAGEGAKAAIAVANYLSRQKA